MNRVLTTGQCAKLMDVAPVRVIEWFYSGRLRGYRPIGSLDIIIERESLVDFMTKSGICVPDELREDDQQVASDGASCEVSETATDAVEKLEAMKQEVSSVLQLMDELAAQWGDEGVFRRCRDRLRVLVSD